MDKSSLKISIITVCFNASNTIEETIISVVKQTYKNIEYIITVSYTHLRAHET